MVSFAVVGYPGNGKSTSIFPNEKAGITGLPPEKTIYVSCAGPAKRIQYANWRKVFDAEKSIKEGGRYTAQTDPIVIANLIKYVASSRKDINYIVIDDANLVMADKVLNRYNAKNKSVSKMDFSDWDELSVTTYQMFKVLDEIIENPDLNRSDLFVIYTFHLNAKDNFNTGESSHVIATSGQSLNRTKPIASMFDIILVANTHYNVLLNKTIYTFEYLKYGDTPARCPIGMFDNLELPESFKAAVQTTEGKIPNDMGLVVKAIAAYDGIELK